MTVKDVNGTTIDPVSLPGSTIVYSTPAIRSVNHNDQAPWYYVNWLVCGVEIVADKLTSDKTKLHLYARVFDYVNSEHSGALENLNPYTRYDNTTYNNTKWSEPYNVQTRVTWNGITGQIFTTTDSRTWEHYFPIDYFISGTATTKGAQTGWSASPEGWIWSGGGNTGRAGSAIVSNYAIQTVSITYDKGSANQGNIVTDKRVIGWDGSGWYLEIIDKPGGYQKTNYHFVGWNTESDGSGTSYSVGDRYYGTQPLTLYAQWASNDMTLSYNKNLPANASEVETIVVPSSVGPVSPGTQIEVGNALDGDDLTPPYKFEAWNTMPDGSGSDYEPGEYYSGQTNQTLYARWSTDYRQPDWSGKVSVFRCDSNGVENQAEQHLRVKGTVIVYKTRFLTNGPYSLVCGPVSTTTFTTTEYGTYYKCSFDIISQEEVVNIGQAYTFNVIFKDIYTNTYNYSPAILTTQKKIGVAFVTFSTNGYGRSVAFGQQAADPNETGPDARIIPSNGRLDIYMDSYFWGTTNITPELATSSTPGIVKPDNTSITVNNGVISGLSVEESSAGSLWDYYISTSADNWVGHNIGWKQEKWSDGRLVVWMWDWYGFASGTPGLTRDEVWNWKSLLEGDSLSLPQTFIDTPTFTISCFARPYSQSTIPQVVYTITGFSNNTSFTLHGVSNLASRAAFIVKLEGHWQ